MNPSTTGTQVTAVNCSLAWGLLFQISKLSSNQLSCSTVKVTMSVSILAGQRKRCISKRLCHRTKPFFSQHRISILSLGKR